MPPLSCSKLQPLRGGMGLSGFSHPKPPPLVFSVLVAALGAAPSPALPGKPLFIH